MLSTEWSQYVRLEMLEDVTLKEFYSNANLYVELKGASRSTHLLENLESKSN